MDGEQAGTAQLTAALEVANKRVAELEEMLKSRQAADQPASKKQRVENGGAGGMTETDRKDTPPDFQKATCAEATWWAPKKVMPSLGAHPIGHIKTCFPRKNGCPRQGSGLEEFSHVWLVFLFNLNGTNYTPKAHVAPPRLRGKVKGVFATRSPHRPNPIGLTLACLERIEGHRLVLSGVDLVDTTPILDIKPYIPSYDMPLSGATGGNTTKVDSPGVKGIRVPAWSQPCRETAIEVTLGEDVMRQLSEIQAGGAQLTCLEDWDAVPRAIGEVLRADPRSVYRSDKCEDKPYMFYFDIFDIKCVFKGQNAEVVSIVLAPPEKLGAPLQAGEGPCASSKM